MMGDFYVRIKTVIKMKVNICKFNTNQLLNSISVYNFVLEANPERYNIEQKQDKYRVNLVISGKGKFIMDAKEYEISQGDIFFSLAHHKYKISGDNEFEYMYITFDGERCRSLFERFGVSSDQPVFCGYSALTAFWQNAILKAESSNMDLISEAVLLYTFGEMTERENTKEQKFVNDIVDLIEESFADGDFNLNTVANELGYNAKYISRVFKKEKQMNFSEYLTNVRLRNAVFLIEQGVTSIKNVAFLSGYKDAFYFSNVFKKNIGITPTEYIKNRSVQS